MPLIYRVMTRDGNLPRVGATGRTLGVRVPADIPVRNGTVSPGTGGMSVSPTWQELPQHRIPKRFARLIPEAAGKNEDACWRMGEGPFEAASVTDGLDLRPDPNRSGHGVVEPAIMMNLVDFETRLAETRELWRLIDEELAHA